MLDFLANEVGEEHAHNYLLLWVHPLNEDNLRSTFPLHFEDKSLRILDPTPVLAKPTLSFRTLALAEGYLVNSLKVVCGFRGFIHKPN